MISKLKSFFRAVPASIAALVLAPALALAAFSISWDGRLISQAGTPVLSACGTSPTITGTDVAGSVVMGTTATGCVITFASARPTGLVPHCVVTWIATPLASQSYTTTVTAITTIQTSTSGNALRYVCFDQPGA